jgi:hypothetical protein
MTLSDTLSTLAFVLSAYSLWHSTMKGAALKVFVPPVIRYASPYNNSNFEVFAIPVTIANEGARTGTVLSMGLVVTDPANRVSKRFYSAELGQWSVEKSRNGDFAPFAPISLAGRASHTGVIQFRPPQEETVMQIVQATGSYQFSLTLDTARRDAFGLIDRILRREPKPLRFEMVLPVLDHRAFTAGAGTLPLHHKDWMSSAHAA